MIFCHSLQRRHSFIEMILGIFKLNMTKGAIWATKVNKNFRISCQQVRLHHLIFMLAITLLSNLWCCHHGNDLCSVNWCYNQTCCKMLKNLSHKKNFLPYDHIHDQYIADHPHHANDRVNRGDDDGDDHRRRTLIWCLRLTSRIIGVQKSQVITQVQTICASVQQPRVGILVPKVRAVPSPCHCSPDCILFALRIHALQARRTARHCSLSGMRPTCPKP